jgi:hypothetical protein
MREVVARLLWQLLCQAKMEALAGPGREISKSGEATASCCFFFFFVKIGKILGLPMCHPFKILRSSID